MSLAFSGTPAGQQDISLKDLGCVPNEEYLICTDCISKIVSDSEEGSKINDCLIRKFRQHNCKMLQTV